MRRYRKREKEIKRDSERVCGEIEKECVFVCREKERVCMCVER